MSPGLILDSWPGGLIYLVLYVHDGYQAWRVPIDMLSTVLYSRGGGWYEFLGMPPRPPGCL